jgi:hypothetical protein
VTAKPSPAIRFTQELADQICNRLAEGESLRSICCDEHMPHVATVCRWLADENHRIFREQYARAREAQADTITDEILDIADDASNDWMERKDADDQTIGWVLNGEHVQRSRLRIDARKWYAGKLAPKKYGEKIQQEHDVAPAAADLLGALMEISKQRDAG